MKITVVGVGYVGLVAAACFADGGSHVICVDNDKKKISIFVFQSGAIIITGANNVNHIMSAYEYITEKLKKNYNKIVKKKLDTLLKNNKTLSNYLKTNT